MRPTNKWVTLAVMLENQKSTTNINHQGHLMESNPTQQPPTTRDKCGTPNASEGRRCALPLTPLQLPLIFKVASSQGHTTSMNNCSSTKTKEKN